MNNKYLKNNKELYEFVTTKNKSLLFKLIRKVNKDEDQDEDGCYNDKLFFKVWRFSIIRNEILKHLQIYIKVNKGSNGKCFQNIIGMKNKENREYINHLVLSSRDSFPSSDFQLPPMVDILEFNEFNHQLRYCWLTTSFSTLIFGNNFNQNLQQGILLESITKLEFGDSFNKLIRPNILPNSIRQLKFGKKFNQPITTENNIIPLNCLYLEFGECFDQILNCNHLPECLRILKIGSNFDKQFLELNKLKSLLKLKFHSNSNFNQSFQMNSLPSSLTSLTFGVLFNQSLSNKILPLNLKSLKFNNSGSNFNQTFEKGDLPNSLLKLINLGSSKKIGGGVLPNSLTKLDLGYYNHPLEEDTLPNNNCLLKLYFGKYYNQVIQQRIIPNSVTFLDLGNYNHKLNIGDLGNSILKLKLPEKYNFPLEAGVIPLSVTDLSIGMNFNQKLNPLDLPIGLKKLEFNLVYNYNDNSNIIVDFFEIGCIPNTVQFLKCSLKPTKLTSNGIKIYQDQLINSVTDLTVISCKERIHESFLPNSITKLDFSNCFYDYRFIPGTLPCNLLELKLPFDYNHLFLENELPKSLTSLYLGTQFNAPLLFIPPSVTLLYLGKRFSQQIKIGEIPNVKKLILKKYFRYKITKEIIPSLTSLNFYNEYD